MNKKFTQDQCEQLKNMVKNIEYHIKSGKKTDGSIKYDYNFFKTWHEVLCKDPPAQRAGSGGIFFSKNDTSYDTDILKHIQK